ncbi:hypothetical protein B0H13DRAFT_1932952 [Mycena leptocephala]|nr:hypothetical protein B0H13DRAFT_1932952 [Mycena leptocephala]
MANTTQSLLKNMQSWQTVKQNKNECSQLMEQTYELLNAILIVHIKSDTGGALPPSVLNHIGKFTEYVARFRKKTLFGIDYWTLHKIHTFVEAQQNGSKVKKFFRQGEMSTLLKDCKAGLQQGFEIFQVPMVNQMKDITQMQEDAEKRNAEVLAMIEACQTQLVQIYHLRSVGFIRTLITAPTQSPCYHQSPRYSMDETQSFQKFFTFSAKEHPGLQFWVQVEWEKPVLQELPSIIQKLLRATQVELAALIGAHVGLKPGKDLTRPVIQYFSSSSDCLLILDNLETLWEPITMRGAERPAKVAWTHPFLPSLKPLEQDAARQTFIDIADSTHDPKEIDKVLSLTDNMPLAIRLIAHLVDSEGCSHVLSHWEEEKTSLISDGYDRTSNLDLSISLSLSSPRLNPHSKDLLSLLSMLPDGLSDVELAQSKFPIDNIQGCKAALIRTALAYSDGHKRLKALVPIREYMQKHQPPGDHLIQPLLKHFQELLEFTWNTEEMNQVLAQLLEYYQTTQTYKILKEFDNPDLKCRLYNALASYYRIKGDISSAKTFGETAISLALSTGNIKWHSQGLYNLAWAEWSLGDYSSAQVHANEAQRLALISADLYREVEALNNEATCYDAFGNYTKAMFLCIRARDLLGLCGMSGGNLDHGIMNAQAEIHRFKSEYVEARSIHTLILEEASIQDPYNYGFALFNVAEIDVLIGAPKDNVQRNCHRARKMLDTAGDTEGVAICDVILADVHMGEGNSLAAKRILERCLKVTLEYSQIQTYCLEQLGDASRWGGSEQMSSWTTVFLVHALKRKEKLGTYKALQFLGDVFLSQNNEHTATNLFTVALEGFTQMDVHCSRAECMLRFGDISMGHGDLLKAVEFWERARPLFERSSQAKQVQHIDERVANISEDVLEQHRHKLARLAELNALAGTVEDLEDDLSDIEDLNKVDMGEAKELGLIVV